MYHLIHKKSIFKQSWQELQTQKTLFQLITNYNEYKFGELKKK